MLKSSIDLKNPITKYKSKPKQRKITLAKTQQANKHNKQIKKKTSIVNV